MMGDELLLELLQDQIDNNLEAIYNASDFGFHSNGFKEVENIYRQAEAILIGKQPGDVAQGTKDFLDQHSLTILQAYLQCSPYKAVKKQANDNGTGEINSQLFVQSLCQYTSVRDLMLQLSSSTHQLVGILNKDDLEEDYFSHVLYGLVYINLPCFVTILENTRVFDNKRKKPSKWVEESFKLFDNCVLQIFYAIDGRVSADIDKCFVNDILVKLFESCKQMIHALQGLGAIQKDDPTYSIVQKEIQRDLVEPLQVSTLCTILSMQPYAKYGWLLDKVKVALQDGDGDSFLFKQCCRIENWQPTLLSQTLCKEMKEFIKTKTRDLLQRLQQQYGFCDFSTPSSSAAAEEEKWVVFYLLLHFNDKHNDATLISLPSENINIVSVMSSLSYVLANKEEDGTMYRLKHVEYIILDAIHIVKQHLVMQHSMCGTEIDNCFAILLNAFISLPISSPQKSVYQCILDTILFDCCARKEVFEIILYQFNNIPDTNPIGKKELLCSTLKKGIVLCTTKEEAATIDNSIFNEFASRHLAQLLVYLLPTFPQDNNHTMMCFSEFVNINFNLLSGVLNLVKYLLLLIKDQDCVDIEKVLLSFKQTRLSCLQSYMIKQNSILMSGGGDDAFLVIHLQTNLILNVLTDIDKIISA